MDTLDGMESSQHLSVAVRSRYALVDYNYLSSGMLPEAPDLMLDMVCLILPVANRDH